MNENINCMGKENSRTFHSSQFGVYGKSNVKDGKHYLCEMDGKHLTNLCKTCESGSRHETINFLKYLFHRI